MASIDKRNTKSGEPRWDVAWRVNGREKSKTFTRRKDAEAFKRKVEHDDLRGLVVDLRGAEEAFAQYANRWVSSRLVRGNPLAPRTVELYQGLLAHHVGPTFGSTPLRAVTTDSVRTWYSALTRSIGPTTAAKSYRLLRSVLATATDDGLIARNPANIKGGGQEHAPERPMVSPEQVEALANAVEAPYRAMVLLAAWCSLRLGELLALRRGSIDLLHGTVFVHESASYLNGLGRVVGSPKTEAGRRTISIPPHIVPQLEQHLASWVAPDPTAALFTGPKGAPLRRASWNSAWDTARQSCHLPQLHFHDLRGAGATWAAGAGATTRELMARLGHASPRAALVYQHATAERDRVVAERLSAFASTSATEPLADVVNLPRDARGMGDQEEAENTGQ